MNAKQKRVALMRRGDRTCRARGRYAGGRILSIRWRALLERILRESSWQAARRRTAAWVKTPTPQGGHNHGTSN